MAFPGPDRPSRTSDQTGEDRPSIARADAPDDPDLATKDLPSGDDVIRLLRLLIACDTFPRGGLYSGYYCLAAALRYEYVWLRILKEHRTKAPHPPLDVALAWLIHRQHPLGYVTCMQRRCGGMVDPPASKAFGFDEVASPQWTEFAHDASHWPPPEPGSQHDPTPAMSKRKPFVAVQLALAMQRFSQLLHSWLRPHFLDSDFLSRARVRYGRFLELHKRYPNRLLVPAADMALFWHTHLAISGCYALATLDLFGQDDPWRPDYLDLDEVQRPTLYAETARLYESEFGEAFSGPDTAWLDPAVQHPLVARGTPVLFALRAFEDSPHQAEQNAAVRAAEHNALTCGSSVRQLFPASRVDAPTRAGAHALFTAWRASTAASAFYDRETCRRHCFTTSWSIRVATIEKTLIPLVGVAHFDGLPASHTHPFLLSITQRKGLWGLPSLGKGGGGGSGGGGRGSGGGGKAEAQAEDDASPSGEDRASAADPLDPVACPEMQSSRRLMFGGTPYTPGDPEAYLDDPALAGLTPLLEAAAAAVRSSTSGSGLPDGLDNSSSEPGGASGSGARAGPGQAQAQARGPAGARHGDAPLWSILVIPEYKARSVKQFDHLWRHASSRGYISILPSGAAKAEARGEKSSPPGSRGGSMRRVVSGQRHHSTTFPGGG
ncbi:hypothetical protein HYH03_005930 [Edaphochlamys debaryana]|uniref:Uncharacterized protein n=1 Tax=Edaphochlamys debaryana TaxID=47281 RepID=A0A835Y4V4_9CHLO|nr:hypothetical protein HYH03_005930 [Edaphochlamys debaryana]|eukprot:KAG2496008.1 hypothetical protein HYH03_005930 [Edaphochlamys debaryana]